MNKTIGLLLVVYGLLLAGLSYLVYHLTAGAARTTLITGLAGGALCLVWGFRALAGSTRKALPLLTLIPVCFTLLPQTFMCWSGGNTGLPGGQTAAVITTLLLVLSLGMLLRIAWSGMVFDLPPAGQMKEGNGQPAPSRPKRDQGSAGRVPRR
ncbi:MAG TPA: hypothetical protein P5205_05015 [Candidatus Paceibacterota bacterium]|nr:hypothetical protein [Verrucomicrobiota bacterium]HSA09714.1 hypothetical protein [Candidatus Paceibacterota bacterium]